MNDENRVQSVEEFVSSDEWLTLAGVATRDATTAQIGTSEAASAKNKNGIDEMSRGRNGASAKSEQGHPYP